MPEKPVLPPGPGKPGSKTEKHLLSADDCPGGLIGRHYQHLRHLYMFGYGSGKVHHFGNVVTGERTDALVHIVGSGFVSTKAHYGEIRLHKAGLMFVTRTGVSTRSMRKPSDRALTAAFVAQYTLPPG